MKRAFSLKSLTNKGPGGWLLLIGGGLVGAYILKNILDHHHSSHAMFANSNNSIYPVHDTDLGDSMNSISPDPFHPNHLGHHNPDAPCPHCGRDAHHCVCGHHPALHHGGHHHGHGHKHGHKTFPDYTDRINTLPTPFFGEHNVPFDSINVDANLNNIGDRGIYIQTFNGNSVGGP